MRGGECHAHIEGLLSGTAKLSAYSLTYTWLVDGRTAKIPAPKFINRVEKWIVSKIHDPVMFPTDPPPVSAANTYASGDINTSGSNTPIAAGPTTLSSSVSSLSGQDWIGTRDGNEVVIFTEQRAGELRGECKRERPFINLTLTNVYVPMKFNCEATHMQNFSALGAAVNIRLYNRAAFYLGLIIIAWVAAASVLAPKGRLRRASGLAISNDCRTSWTKLGGQQNKALR